MATYPALNKALVIDPSGELRDFLRFCAGRFWPNLQIVSYLWARGCPDETYEWAGFDLVVLEERLHDELIDAVGLNGFSATPAVELAYGRKRALEIATTLALDPEMMLLDEPTAGMTHSDVDRIAALIKKVAANRTVLMVEHNLSVVSTLSDHITVLARGEILAQGDYAAVSKNADVIQAYLGAGHA